jgi:hypothetical protein
MIAALEQHARTAAAVGEPGEKPDAEPVDDGDDCELCEDLEEPQAA